MLSNFLLKTDMLCSNLGDSRAIIKRETGLLWWKWEDKSARTMTINQTVRLP